MADFPGDARQTKRFVVFVLDVSRGALSTSGVAGHVLVETRIAGITRGVVGTLGCFFSGRAYFTREAIVAKIIVDTISTTGKTLF